MVSSQKKKKKQVNKYKEIKHTDAQVEKEQQRSFPLSITFLYGTVFVSNFAIMVLELVASRLIAGNLGTSLYTWTAVIGVVLGGITIGNYIGGRFADSYPPKKALSILFSIASFSCVIVIILNNIIGGCGPPQFPEANGFPFRAFLSLLYVHCCFHLSCLSL